MICPSCKNEIADSSIICPICNTQFAFNVSNMPQSPEANINIVKSSIDINTYPKNNVNNNMQEESAFSPNDKVIPTEVSHYPEEEINPTLNAMKYANTNQNNNEEIMHIPGQTIEQGTPYNPSAPVVSTPIRPETPIAANNVGTYLSQTPMENNNPGPFLPQPPTVAQNQMPTQPVQSQMVQTVMPTNMPANMNNGSVVNPNTAINQNGVRQVQTANSVTQNILATSGINEEKKKFKTEDIFFGAVSAIGLILFVIIAISLFTNNKKVEDTPKKTTNPNVTERPSVETDNVGFRSTFNYPAAIGETTLASIYDTLNQKYVDVDVTGIRFIEGTEAVELAKNYATDSLIDGFSWYGLEYRVKFNDLKSLTGTGISPVLNSTVYMWNGGNFVTYNEKNYTIKTYDIYNAGPIVNTKTANIIVVYQMPTNQKEYSVCLGYLGETMGCFAK